MAFCFLSRCPAHIEQNFPLHQYWTAVLCTTAPAEWSMTVGRNFLGRDTIPRHEKTLNRANPVIVAYSFAATDLARHKHGKHAPACCATKCNQRTQPAANICELSCLSARVSYWHHNPVMSAVYGPAGLGRLWAWVEVFANAILHA